MSISQSIQAVLPKLHCSYRPLLCMENEFLHAFSQLGASKTLDLDEFSMIIFIL